MARFLALYVGSDDYYIDIENGSLMSESELWMEALRQAQEHVKGKDGVSLLTLECLYC